MKQIKRDILTFFFFVDFFLAFFVGFFVGSCLQFVICKICKDEMNRKEERVCDIFVHNTQTSRARTDFFLFLDLFSTSVFCVSEWND